MLAILFGLCSALSWGSGDFTGGLASRRSGAYRTVFYGEVIGTLVLILVVSLISEPLPELKVWLLSMLAGVLGSIGLLLLYHSMTLGLMSIAAPVSALLAAVLPVVAGTLLDGLPKTLTLLGFALALFAVWMISQSAGGVTDVLAHLSDLKLPLLAGLGFGLYFVFMHAATGSGGLAWPMIASRLGGMALIVLYMLFSRTAWRVEISALPLIALNGVLDICGNGFFILAGQAGRLDVAAVISSLYPGATVMLAWIFLKERLTRNQWIGILSALAAIVLMTI